MDYKERKIKNTIKEAIWAGILEGNKVSIRENPYAFEELLEQNQEWLNIQTDKYWKELNILYGER